MIANDQELNTSVERIHHLSASGFRAEIDRMQLEVREYLSLHPGAKPA
jgi:hypothetical protein